MKKIKLFLENFLIYGFGGIISKLIPLIMVPVITRIMPNSEYFGIYDLSNTVVSLCSSLAIMGMYDSMYRLFFEKEEEAFKQEICSTAFLFTLGTSALVFAVMVLCRKAIAIWFLNDEKLSYLVYFQAMATLIGATNGILSAPTRMQNKRRIFLVMNTVIPLISYGIAIPMLLRGYYIIALPLAGLLSAAANEMVFAALNRKWFSPHKFRWAHVKPLLAIAIPLFPNFVIYWLYNSSDRLMITNLAGIGDAGLYAVGSKLGQASQLIYTAFAGGWQYFAFSTMKEGDQVKINSLVFEYLGVISFLSSFFICALAGLIYRILFVGEYVNSYIVSPYLFLAPLLQMLYQVAGNQFLVIKKTWPSMVILLGGAIANVALNFILIPRIGIEGAAIATVSGYIITDIICVWTLCRMKLMIMRRNFLYAAFFTAAFFVLWRTMAVRNTGRGLILAMIFSGILISLYRKDLQDFWSRFRTADGR